MTRQYDDWCCWTIGGRVRPLGAMLHNLWRRATAAYAVAQWPPTQSRLASTLSCHTMSTIFGAVWTCVDFVEVTVNTERSMFGPFWVGKGWRSELETLTRGSRRCGCGDYFFSENELILVQIKWNESTQMAADKKGWEGRRGGREERPSGGKQVGVTWLFAAFCNSCSCIGCNNETFPLSVQAWPIFRLD